jgi:phosphate transport system permease protein
MRSSERFIIGFLGACTALTLFITAGILYTLCSEAINFFSEVSIRDFLTDTQWTPLYTEKHFGIIPLLCGTLLTGFIAIFFALPIGLTIAIYLNEYAPRSFSHGIKPVLEILAAVPTVVYGYFALTVVTPFLQSFIPGLAGFNALGAGFVIGIMIIPLISSMSQDALYAVPKSIREASYGLGATRLQTAFQVLVPAASSGIIVSVIVAISRAIGETMIVAIAAGMQPNLTLDPTVPIQTITTYILQISMGNVPHDSLEYQTIFAAGISLFALTFIMNIISYWFKKEYKIKYE